MKLIVTLNGTDSNRWNRWNLQQNPFPQIPKLELHWAMSQLNSLDGDPLTGEEDIRARLRGWSEEFVLLCIRQFKPGSRVRFEVEFPDAL